LVYRRSVGETEIAMVRRHVQEGEANLRHQRERIGYFRTKGYDVASAERLLASFEQIQDAHVAHLNRLLAISN
jgi:hypothetical protein